MIGPFDVVAFRLIPISYIEKHHTRILVPSISVLLTLPRFWSALHPWSSNHTSRPYAKDEMGSISFGDMSRKPPAGQLNQSWAPVEQESGILWARTGLQAALSRLVVRCRVPR
jgi:hypothetical protein